MSYIFIFIKELKNCIELCIKLFLRLSSEYTLDSSEETILPLTTFFRNNGLTTIVSTQSQPSFKKLLIVKP